MKQLTQNLLLHLRQSAALWLFLLLLSLYLMTLGGQLFTSDGAAMYRTTQALVRYHTLAVAPDPGLPQLVIGWDGQTYSGYDLGQPLLAIPFYLLGWLLARLLPHGNEMALTIFSVSLLPQVATALTGVVLYKLSFGLFRTQRIAIALPLLWGTGTLAWPYSKFYFGESLLSLFLLLACWLVVQAQQRHPKSALLVAGSALGTAIAVRAAAAIYFPAFLAYLLLEQRKKTANRTAFIGPFLGQASLFTMGVFPAMCLFLWHNYRRFHAISHTGYAGQGFTTPLYVGLYGLLFSSGRSLFVYSPLLLLGVVSLAHFGQQFPALRLFILTACATVIPFYSMWWTWHGGWSWGPRFLVPLAPFLLLPLGAKLATRPWWRATGLVWLGSLLVVIPGVSVDFNPYIINSIQGDYANESRLWFFPWASPIIGHWHYLLTGQALTFGGTHLSDFGLPRVTNLIFLPIMGLIFLIALIHIVRIWQQPEVSSPILGHR